MTNSPGDRVHGIVETIRPLLGSDARLVHPRAGYDRGLGGGDFDFAVERIDLRWPLRAPPIRVCQCIRHSPGGWYWVIESAGEVLAIDALDDPLGIGPLNFPTKLAFGRQGAAFIAVRAAFITMKRLRKRQYGADQWRLIGDMARTDPRTFDMCLQATLGSSLGKQVSRSVVEGTIPPRDVRKRVTVSLRVRRIRTPTRAATLLLRSTERLIGRLRHSTGLTVVVVGPDGAGKSAVASALVRECRPFFWRVSHLHWRPGLLPRAGTLLGSRRGDPRHPHRSAPHGTIASTALLLYYWMDFLVGGLLKVKMLRARSALIVVERGWSDIAVDPRRYRMRAPGRVVGFLGRIVPKPDLTLLLEAPSPELLRRKQEISIEELDRQAAQWRHIARTSKSVQIVDTDRPIAEVHSDATETVISFLERRTASRTGEGWLTVRDEGSMRWLLPRGSRAVAAEGLRIYQPVTLRGRLAWETARAVATLGCFRLLPRGDAPEPWIRNALAPYMPPRGSVAVMRGGRATRCVALILDPTGGATAFAKLAADDRGKQALAKEQRALSAVSDMVPQPLRTPAIIDSHDGLLLLEAIPWHPRLRPWHLPIEVAHALGVFHAAGRRDGSSIAHGDFAPWNLLETTEAWVVVDWEDLRIDAPPFYDVFHYLVQACALLRKPSPMDIVLGLTRVDCPTGMLFQSYASGAQLDTRSLVQHFLDYVALSRSTLDAATPDGHRGMQVRDALVRLVKEVG